MPGGIGSHWVPMKGFRYIALDNFPLSQAWPGAPGIYYDAKSKPLREARLALYRLDPETQIADHPTRQFFGTVRTDESGAFSWDTLRPGTYLIETIRTFPGGVHTEESRSYRRVELRNGEHKTIELGNDLGAIVFTGRLLDRNGVAVQQAWLRLRPAFDWHYVEFGAAISAEHASRFWYPGLQPGKYAVEAAIFTDAGTRTIALPPIELTQSMERDLEVAFAE